MRYPCLLALVVLFVAHGAANAFETAAKAAILMDYRTGNVLFAKDPDEALPPASMSKLMTARVAFDEIADGNLKLDQELPVSEKAWRMGGSKMFVEVGKRVKVEDLLRGMIIQSGNDACIVLAEGLAGSEEAFADLMNARADALGLKNSHFANATGWPNPGQLMSVRDLAILGRSIVKDFPQFYSYYGTKEFTYNDIVQYNRNPLLRADVPGVDGMKTGYTEEAGYGLVASAKRDGQRLIMVVAGLNSARERGTEAQKLLEYGFRTFKAYRLFEPDRPLANVPVWQGERSVVPLVAQDPVVVTLTRDARDSLTARVLYDSPIAAPIEAGQKIGTIEVMAPGSEMIQAPLVAAEAVPRASLMRRIQGTLSYLIFGPEEAAGGLIEPFTTSAAAAQP